MGWALEVTHDQRLAETFFAGRAQSTQALPPVGAKALGGYVAEKGFAGDDPHTQWPKLSGAQLITAPDAGSKKKWPQEWRGAWAAAGGRDPLRPPAQYLALGAGAPS